MPTRFGAALLAASIVLLSGCAVGRSVVPAAAVDAGINPAQGRALRIAVVEDARVFSVKPPSPDIPSVMDDDIGNKAVTSRAVGRKRGGLGLALGDVLLPEDTSVAAVVQTAVTRALRQSGYRVLASGDSGYEQAVPIRARVEQFWSWFSPGFTAVKLTNRAAVNLQGDIAPLQQGRTFSSEVSESMQAVLESDWAAIVAKGLDGLTEAIRNGLR